jgi:hypothetical protein
MQTFNGVRDDVRKEAGTRFVVPSKARDLGFS